MPARSTVPFVVALLLMVEAGVRLAAAQPPQPSGNPPSARLSWVRPNRSDPDFDELNGAPVMCTGAWTEPEEILPNGTMAQPAPRMVALPASDPATLVLLRITVAEVDAEAVQCLGDVPGANGSWQGVSTQVAVVSEKAHQALEALSSVNLARVLSTPRLMNADGATATCLIGINTPFPEFSGPEDHRGGCTLRELSVHCQARVLPGGLVHLEFEPTVTVHLAGKAPAETLREGLNTFRVHLAAELATGQTLAVSGIVPSAKSRLVCLVTAVVVHSQKEAEEKLNDWAGSTQAGRARPGEKGSADPGIPPQPARVGEIKIVGNTATKADVILRAMQLHPGQHFTDQDVRLAEERLARLGLFEGGERRPSITVVEDDNRENHYQDLLVTVHEKCPGRPERWR